MHLGHEGMGVGCTLVVTGVGVDGSDVGVDGEGVDVEGSGVRTGVEDSVGVMVTRGSVVLLASRITHLYDVLVPPLSKITSRDSMKRFDCQCTRQ